ncbi:MAG: hypothetical protein VYC39_04365 [Myxococcota bacterium]|nr:hypothetical protein [Myxococcota bacterium]
MTAELIRSHHQDPAEFQASLQNRLFEHQVELMTDPALLDSPQLYAISSIVSRCEIPKEIQSILTRLGLERVNQDNAVKPDAGFFGKMLQNSKKRVRLSKWSLRYLRSGDVNERLGRLEEELDQQPYPEKESEAAKILSAIVANVFAKPIGKPNIENLEQLESIFESIFHQTTKTAIMRANSVRYLTSYLTETVKYHARLSQWEDEDNWEGRYFVQSNEEILIHFEPAAKVVEYLTSGTKDRLSTYAKSVIRQSLTSNA